MATVMGGFCRYERVRKIALVPDEFTQEAGELSPTLLLDAGCRYCIIGHSERRAYHAESDQLVAEKFAAAMQRVTVGDGFAEGVDRDRVIERLGERGIAAKPYLPCIHLQPFYREDHGHRRGTFPNTEAISASTRVWRSSGVRGRTRRP